MSVALIGLVGVIAGALISGWMSSRLEQRKRVLDAKEAQRLIAAELVDSANRLESAVEVDKWFSRDLPDERWREGARPLLVAVGATIGGQLSNSYGLIQAWNAESRRRIDSTLTGQEKTAFDDAAKALRKVSERLQAADLKPSHESGRQGFSTAIVVAAGFAVLVVLAYAVFVPRPNLTDQTIASALQSKLGGRALVACNEHEDGWLCHASLPPPRRPTCGNRAGTRVPGARNESVVLVAKSQCSKPSRSSVEFEVAEGSSGPVATPSADSKLASKYLETLMIQLNEPEESAVGSFWDQLRGRR